MLRLCRETVVRLGKTESALVRSLQRDTLLVERVERLMTIPAVGPITALTWALEVGDVRRFSSIKKAISYCGLCGAERSPGGTTKRTPLSKQRNKHLQTILIEPSRPTKSLRCGILSSNNHTTPFPANITEAKMNNFQMYFRFAAGLNMYRESTVLTAELGVGNLADFELYLRCTTGNDGARRGIIDT